MFTKLVFSESEKVANICFHEVPSCRYRHVIPSEFPVPKISGNKYHLDDSNNKPVQFNLVYMSQPNVCMVLLFLSAMSFSSSISSLICDFHSWHHIYLTQQAASLFASSVWIMPSLAYVPYKTMPVESLASNLPNVILNNLLVN